QAGYLVIGSLWLKSQDRERYKKAIHTLRDKYRVGGEFKWTKVTPSKVEFYKALITWFHEQGEILRFRCISIDHKQVNLIRFHQNDQELGFYKFYYQMIHHWIHPFNEYRIYCDYKHNRLRTRLHTLKICLNNANLAADIETVQSVRSRESVLLQLSDVLVGISSASLNSRLREGSAKKEVVLHLEGLMGRKIVSTPLSEKKFNVFKINLQGGW
ncbi:MAG TPA: DUF3800 domain-containing protein, partial [Desulfatiglandales bacterium]|nr:DUF3800 domain-containing protein [Desulfatiglandales bacterium]